MSHLQKQAFLISTFEQVSLSSKLLLDVPRVFTEFGKISFSFYALRLWNEMHNTLMLEVLPSVNIL